MIGQRSLETREELLKRLDKAIKKAAEHGLDVKLGFANAEDFSEEGGAGRVTARVRGQALVVADLGVSSCVMPWQITSSWVRSYGRRR